MDDPLASPTVIEVYDDPSLAWYLRGSGPELHPGGELATAALIERASASGFATGGLVLDIASALGTPGRVVARRFASTVVGLDMNPAMHRASRAGALREQLGPRCRQVTGRTERMPFRDASFDAAWSQDALCHMDQGAVIAEAARVLRTGAIFALSDFIAKPGHTEEDREALRRTWAFPRLASIPEYVALLTAHGFEVLLAEDRTAAIAAWRPAAPPPDNDAWLAGFALRWGSAALETATERFRAWGEIVLGGRGGFALFIARRLA